MFRESSKFAAPFNPVARTRAPQRLAPAWNKSGPTYAVQTWRRVGFTGGTSEAAGSKTHRKHLLAPAGAQERRARSALQLSDMVGARAHFQHVEICPYKMVRFEAKSGIISRWVLPLRWIPVLLDLHAGDLQLRFGFSRHFEKTSLGRGQPVRAPYRIERTDCTPLASAESPGISIKLVCVSVCLLQ